MKILITGTGGFVGNELLAYIEKNNLFRNDEIILLTSKKIPHYRCVLHKNYNFTNKDLQNCGLYTIDILLHIGAFVPKVKRDFNDADKNLSTLRNTCHLLNTIGRITRKIILISSISVYNSEEETVINEDTPPRPDTVYGLTKLYQEKIISEFCKDSIPYSILRLGVTYGNYKDEGLIPVSVKNILNKISPKVFNGGNEERTFIHVEDCCRIICEEIKRNQKSNLLINVTSREHISCINLIKLIQEVVGVCIPVIEIDDPSFRNISTIFDITRLVELYGQNTISLQTGLTRYVEFYKRQICKAQNI